MMYPTTIQHALDLSIETFQRCSLPHPKQQAQWLLCSLLQCPLCDLYLDPHKTLLPDQQQRWKAWVEKRVKRMPLAYIEGKTTFCSLEFFVSSDVLIPRQETEIITQKILTHLDHCDLEGKTLVDVGTGSGCIAISIKKRFPDLHVIGIDLCPKALCLTKKNCDYHNVSLSLYKGDLLSPLLGKKIDFCVSNPPYIGTKEKKNLEPEVLHYEPILALFGGEDGLDIFKKLASTLPDYLSSKGKVWLEVGYQQKEAIDQLFTNSLWKKKKWYQDYSGYPRFFFLERE